MPFRKQFRQTCLKCNGTGTSKKILKNKDDQVILAPAYHDPKDNGRPQYEPCTECDFKGSGMALYDSPKEVLVDGAKIVLDDVAQRARFSDSMTA